MYLSVAPPYTVMAENAIPRQIPIVGAPMKLSNLVITKNKKVQVNRGCLEADSLVCRKRVPNLVFLM